VKLRCGRGLKRKRVKEKSETSKEPDIMSKLGGDSKSHARNTTQSRRKVIKPGAICPGYIQNSHKEEGADEEKAYDSIL
jgi:hypothetical protein